MLRGLRREPRFAEIRRDHLDAAVIMRYNICKKMQGIFLEVFL